MCFIGFYSTLPSSGLSGCLKGLSEKTEIQIFDKEKIESCLLKSSDGLHLSKRYFPNSIKTWIGENPKPAKIFAEHPVLHCKYCNKNLLEPKPTGIIVLWYKRDSEGRKHYSQIYWCCKGACDRTLKALMLEKGCIDGWEDIPDVAIPLVFARWIMTPLNGLNSGYTYSPNAFENLKDFILNVYPFVARNNTQDEDQRIQDLSMIPAYLGGLGY
jgi:hypothetical protein